MPDVLEVRGEGDTALTLLAADLFPTRIEAQGYWTPHPIEAGTIFHLANRKYELTRALEAGIAVIGGRDLYELDQPVTLEAIRE